MRLSTLNKGLVGHWSLDQESFNPATKRFTDKTPNENHGTGNGTQLGSVSPGFQADRMGQLVRAAPFNGTDDYVNCGNDSSLNITDAITISHWFNPASIPFATNRILAKWSFSGVSDRSYQITFNGNKNIAFDISNDGTNFKSSGDYTLDINNWYHIIAVFKPSTYIRIYIDGQLCVENILAIPPIIHGGNGSVFVGATDSDGAGTPLRFFHGHISDVRIYNRALSQQEVTALYEHYRTKILIGC